MMHLEACHYYREASHYYREVISHLWRSHPLFIGKSSPIYGEVISHLQRNHLSFIEKPPLVYREVTSHLWRSHLSFVEKSPLIYRELFLISKEKGIRAGGSGDNFREQCMHKTSLIYTLLNASLYVYIYFKIFLVGKFFVAFQICTVWSIYIYDLPPPSSHISFF